jgi:hypothetical protein
MTCWVGSPVFARRLWWIVAMSHSTAIAAITTIRLVPLAVISICTPRGGGLPWRYRS